MSTCKHVQLLRPVANQRELVLSRRRRPKLTYDRDQLYLKSCRSTRTFSTRRHKLKLQLVAVSSIVSQGRHTPALMQHGVVIHFE